MLAQFALIVFGICAVLGLIVDIGYVRLTQAQMQNAVDAAAIDGLRRNRAAARDLAQRVFDDDLDPAEEDPARRFGAGPILDLTEGLTSLHAAQTLSVPDPYVYEPDLQLNTQNEAYGDIVRGTFVTGADPTERSDYSRDDFASTGTSALLVRMRRSNELQELDVASSGPTLPLLFGKGTTIHGDDPASEYSIRRDGITVRATAIASGQRAVRVGIPQPQAVPPLPGVSPFALVDTFVIPLAGGPGAGAGAQVVIDRNGFVCPAVTVTPLPPCTAANAIGRFVANRAAIASVGQPLPNQTVFPPATACGTLTVFQGYGARYWVMVNRIVGFTQINMVTRNPTAAEAAANLCAASVSRAAPTAATSNATANPGALLPLPAGLPPAQLTPLINRHRTFDYGALLVAGLVR